MMITCPPAEYFENGFSNEIEEKLEEIHDYENKINNLLLEEMTKFTKENKELIEKNKISQMELTNVKELMRNAQNDAENWKRNYKILQMKNENLLLKLQNTKKISNNNATDYSKELPRKKRWLSNENNSKRTYSTVEG